MCLRRTGPHVDTGIATDKPPLIDSQSEVVNIERRVDLFFVRTVPVAGIERLPFLVLRAERLHFLFGHCDLVMETLDEVSSQRAGFIWLRIGLTELVRKGQAHSNGG